ncbi:hypothetical protein BDV95DRAFT_83034 [Massariosphaeria phaeospora]|uniref:Uncharacterized protein n=1 Tax=Massariosphaeria phaeospora TaxID=100035 RepID=A0A7C8I359_9PLEO|nr:hypothetical protein BDV95DRAFT_83034 [Massariosphaeria phaeospora]
MDRHLRRCISQRLSKTRRLRPARKNGGCHRARARRLRARRQSWESSFALYATSMTYNAILRSHARTATSVESESGASASFATKLVLVCVPTVHLPIRATDTSTRSRCTGFVEPTILARNLRGRKSGTRKDNTEQSPPTARLCRPSLLLQIE